MVQLENFKPLDQLSELNINGQVDINNQFDCVATSIAAGMRYLIGGNWTGAQLKDETYGVGYTGATDANSYVAYCAQQGVHLVPLDENSTQSMIAAIKKQIDRKHVVIATELDPYANPNLGWTHVICFYAYDEPEGTLCAADPWAAQNITKSTGDWQTQFVGTELWVLYKEGDTLMGGIPKGWGDAGGKLKPDGCNFDVVLGFREYILSHDWDSGNWPLENERGLPQIEISNPELGEGTRQRFRTTTLEWTKEKGVFIGWSGQELIALEAHLINQINLVNQLKAEIQQSQTPNPQPKLSPQTQQVLSSLREIINDLLPSTS